MSEGRYIVADFGKTNAKLTLWSRDGECLAKETRANDVPSANPYVPLDVVGISEWLIATLAKFAGEPVEAIIPVAHGAAVAGIARGKLAFLPMDYEWEIPADIASAYRKERQSFSFTGSPALPAGLNMGTQLYYLDSLGLLEGATLMPYAQYWSWWLSGNAVSEVTSLGCHSDLWYPGGDKFVWAGKQSRWAEQFAALVGAGDRIGNLKPEIAQLTGLSSAIRVHAGLHDSNAALVAARGFPEIADRDATIVSTGTWFVAMRSGAFPIENGSPAPATEIMANGTVVMLPFTDLPEGRDCLFNVDVERRPVPSARYMGGREAELLGGLCEGLAGLDDVLASGTMILPSQVQGSGPFPNAQSACLNGTPSPAATALYLALMTETSLSLIGTKCTLLIEGRFAEYELFTRALATLRPDLRVFTVAAEADVSFGALRMIDPALKPSGALERVKPLAVDLTGYQAQWLALTGR